MSSMPLAQPEITGLHVSAISISLSRDSGKTIGSIELGTQKGSFKKDVQKIMRAGDMHEEKFDPPSLLQLDDHIIVTIKCSSKYRKRSDFVIDINLRDNTCRREDQGVRLYRKKHRNVEVVVTSGYNYQPQLFATTAELAQYCPKFRVLIIGNTGVGKSSLIHRVFGVKGVDVSEKSRGFADIDKEFVSPTNERFIVHDSLGFEAGDKKHMELVTKFVAERKAQRQLKDQLHAIWLCLETPYSGGRLLEGGVEMFLRNREETLGKVPIIIVLTKVDQLDFQLEIDLPEDKTMEEFKSAYMNEYIIDPLHNAAGKDITYVAVSTADNYSSSLSDLTKTTDDTMKKYNVEEATRIAAIAAQRVSIKEKIDASIAIGKKKYWNTLMKSTFFRGHTLKECLQVIRDDITSVWNFNDPDLCLADNKIFDILLENLGDNPTENPSSFAPSFSDMIKSGIELARNLADVHITLVALAPAASILMYAGKMAYNAVQQAKNDVKIIMLYIVNWICVMQVIFLLDPGQRVTEETVTRVLEVCKVSRASVYRQVDAFHRNLGVLPAGRDAVLDKIEELIWHYSIPDDQIGALRKEIRGAMLSSSA